jgi:hypothetical protein
VSVLKYMKSGLFLVLLILGVTIALADNGQALRQSRAGNRRESKLRGWRTNTAKRTVELHELEPGGPDKDGIPAINRPVFVKPGSARQWLEPNEPVISLVIDDQSRAYPLQILMWHEIVNDEVAGVPVAVTFCPLCYSANVFDRRVRGRSYSLGVSGMLRHSDMVMYDRETESLWQQISGEAIVGDMVGSQLKRIPAQIISFEQFRSAYKRGLVLSRETGFQRNYGQNPYVGYDDISNRPFKYRGNKDGRLMPMEKVVTVSIGDSDKAYPYSITQRLNAINDKIADVPLVVFHAGGAVSALDKGHISSSRRVGSTGVFDRRVDGRLLSFRYSDSRFYDEQTASAWDITGRAVQGPLEGKRLTRLVHGDYFAFAWLVFKPETEIYQ